MTTPQIVTYRSDNTPNEDARWLAVFCVPIRQDKKQSQEEGRNGPHAVDKEHEEIGRGKPSRHGYLPLVVYGRTQEEVRVKAEEIWERKRLEKIEQKRKSIERAEKMRKVKA